jgi:hypothetical protein
MFVVNFFNLCKTAKNNNHFRVHIMLKFCEPGAFYMAIKRVTRQRASGWLEDNFWLIK